MPYPADAHDWDAFWEQLGKPEETKAPTVNKFKKIGWSMIGISGAIKNKPKPMKRLPSRRMSTAGFRQLQNRASRLSLSQESFVKQNKKTPQKQQQAEENSQQNKRDSSLIQRVESHVSHANNNA